MEVTIVIPFWGNHPAYRAWLVKWLEYYEVSGCAARVIVASDEVLADDIAPDCQHLLVDTSSFRDLIDPANAYDRKGAIVCATALAMPDLALFILDADAWLMANPLPLLSPFAQHAIAMPFDEGALGKPYAAPHGDIVRRCAGVMWFGAKSLAVRHALVAEYRAQYFALRRAISDGTFSEERRLLEQHAWTFVADRVASPILPRELNWPVCFKTVGVNKRAAIHHHIGRKKWTGHERPPAGVLNERQVHLLSAQGGAA